MQCSKHHLYSITSSARPIREIATIHASLELLCAMCGDQRFDAPGSRWPDSHQWFTPQSRRIMTTVRACTAWHYEEARYG
jgi:hypothetical protein